MAVVTSIPTWQMLKEHPEKLEQYLVRESVFQAIRQFFVAEHFHEVETPLLVERPSTETYLEFFQTELMMADGTKRPGFLTTSPEYAMKKLIAAGLTNIFQICKSFRNEEGHSRFHNPEFTILEWYRTPADYRDVMADCERLLLFILDQVAAQRQLPHWAAAKRILTHQGRQFKLQTPWLRLSVAEAFKQYAQIDIDTLTNEAALVAAAAAKGYQVTPATTWEEAYHQLFLNEIEPRLAELDQPVFLYDYPASQAALSRRKASDPRFAERFEWYLGGIELGNAFSELTDAVEQEERLRADLKLRQQTGKKQYQLDEDFITALQSGLPETSGIAVGVDRLIMLVADAASIHQTMFFPYFDVFTVGQGK